MTKTEYIIAILHECSLANWEYRIHVCANPENIIGHAVDTLHGRITRKQFEEYSK